MRVKKSNLDKTLEYIQRYNPEKISFKVFPTKGYVFCIVRLSSALVIGTAICSTLDTFNEIRGKTIAAGRALKALIHQTSSESVRRNLHQFPGNWSIKQALRVANCPLLFKSQIGRIKRSSVK